MKIVFYLNVISPHQVPLAREIVARVGVDNFRYIYTQQEDGDHAALKFGVPAEQWFLSATEPVAATWLETADLVFSGLRDLDLFDRRAARGLKTFYTSERWFKPRLGRLRMLFPAYRRMAHRFLSLVRQYDTFRVFPVGVHAERDFKCLGVPQEKMTLWGYFVAPSSLGPREDRRSPDGLRVLLFGRSLPLKRLDTIRTAVASVPGASLDVYSNLTLAGVRAQMRAHDVLVLASNGYEGWGAVVSEALEEGMRVLGTYEAGASATLLPRERLFHAGDAKALSRLLTQECRNELPPCGIGTWTARCAAEKLLAIADVSGCKCRAAETAN